MLSRRLNLVKSVLRKRAFSSTSSSSSRLILPKQSHGLILPSSASVASSSKLFSTAPSPAMQSATTALHDISASYQNYPMARVTQLPNGMRVITEPSTGTDAAAVGVFIDSGSRFENAENNGVAHFLEHLTFKGTRKRSQHFLEVEVENMGGHLNAYTSREQTFYYAKVLRHDLEHGMDILADILQNSLLEPIAIERERSVILREAEEVAKQHEEVVFDNLHLAAFPDHGLGYTILGPPENILKMQRKHVQEYIATHYIGPRLVVVAAGAVDHNEVVELTKKLFSKVPAQGIAPVTRTKPAFVPREARQHVDDDPRVDTANFAVAFEAPHWSDADSVPFMVLQQLLGAWDSAAAPGDNSISPLIREAAKRHLARHVSTFHSCYSDTGLFGVYVSTEPENAKPMLRLIGQELAAMSSPTYITEEVLELAKTQVKVCEDIGRQLLCYGRRIHPMEMAKRVEAVDVAAVVNCVRRYVWNRRPAISAYGQLQDFPDEQELPKYLMPSVNESKQKSNISL